jgi:hypothetical protein
MSGWVFPVLGSGQLYKATIDTLFRSHNNNYFLNCADTIATDALGNAFGRYHFSTCNTMISGNPLVHFRSDQSQFIISKTGLTTPVLTMQTFSGWNASNGANLILENTKTSDDSYSSIISKGTGDQAGAHINFIATDESVSAFGIGFYTRGANATNTQQVMTIDSGRKVGIRTTDPDAPLHIKVGDAGSVTPDTSFDDFLIESDGNVGMTLMCPDASNASIGFASPSDAVGARVQWAHSEQKLIIGTSNTNDFIQFQNKDENDVMIITGESVGINIQAPRGTLEVSGSGIHLTYDYLNAGDPGIRGQLYRDGSNQIFVSAG